MTQQTLNIPPFRSDFTTGDSSERGDTPTDLVTKLQAMLTELYASIASLVITSTSKVAKYTKNTTVGATAAAVGDLTGAQDVVCEYSAVGAAALTLRTAAQMFAEHAAIVGQTYILEIMNTSGGTTTVTAPNGSATITGTATIATNTARWFVVTFVSATTMTLQNIGTGSV